MSSLKWSKILSTQRIERTPDGTIELAPPETEDYRSEFDRDFSRVIFSAPFRRLQNKTQVFPSDPTDYVRNRLTHSYEVSSVAKGLAFSVGRWLSDNETQGEKYGFEPEHGV